MSYQDDAREHLRITILRFLKDDCNYTINESLLRDLVDRFGFYPSSDTMRTELMWLAEQGRDGVTSSDHAAANLGWTV